MPTIWAFQICNGNSNKQMTVLGNVWVSNRNKMITLFQASIDIFSDSMGMKPLNRQETEDM